MYMGICVYVCVPPAYSPSGARRGHQISWNWTYLAVRHHVSVGNWIWSPPWGHLSSPHISSLLNLNRLHKIVHKIGNNGSITWNLVAKKELAAWPPLPGLSLSFKVIKEDTCQCSGKTTNFTLLDLDFSAYWGWRGGSVVKCTKSSILLFAQWVPGTHMVHTHTCR